ncbi:cytochrome P450 [Mycena galericulata]|nr:cytochrome P450 [Mycena galericulata]
MPLYVYGAAAAALLVILRRYFQRGSKLPLPPGPKKLPLVGNLFDMPTSFEWETYMKWSQIYNSDIIHLNVAGTSIIVLSSVEAANDLLEKRSSLYSDRARLPMVNELMGWTRDYRRLFHQAFNPAAARDFHPKERAASHELLRRLLRDPDNVMDHLRHLAGEIIMSVAYGIKVQPQNDPFIALSKAALHSLVIASVPGKFLVDVIPALQYVPDWFPGAGFKRTAKRWNKLSQDMMELPFAEAKRRIASGSALESFTSVFLNKIDNAEDPELKEQTVKEVAGNMYTGGADTTVSALGTFFLAMIANPEAQKNAQKEIDTVIGNGHLPDFEDEDSLPYVSAIVKEVLPIPHFLPVEDEYKGYRLPAGSIVIPNAWAILHDETIYPEPHAFRPERFLLGGKPNPAMNYPDAAFGFGRRICPGRHMASSSVWISVVSVLSTFDITKAVGDDGQVIEPTHEYFPALINMPLPFTCSIKPRSQKAAELILATLNEGEQ